MAKINNDMTHTNVWIELDPTDKEDVGKHRCDLANKMLEKLGCTIGPMEVMFEWLPKRHYAGTAGYIFYKGGGAFEELSDNGRWFNLEFLAK